MKSALTIELAEKFATVALSHVTREYPSKLDHVMAGPGDAKTPKELHPVFFGSYDWHSCVHGYWLLATLYRCFPDAPVRHRLRTNFEQFLTSEGVERERLYLARPESQSFERPYGWAWLLMLAAELMRHKSPEAKAWSGTLAPLAQDFAKRFKTYLPKQTYPIRTGAHPNSAFALALAWEYAEIALDGELQAIIAARARAWYGLDEGCQAWEPDGDAFLSPALTEAACMRRILPRDEFRAWFARFLPDLERQQPATLFAPAQVSDRSDMKIAHLDGLNLSRAWCWRSIAGALTGPAKHTAEEAAAEHLAAGLPHIAGDYAGEHWLASFALLALRD
jgi:hypothetical protein